MAMITALASQALEPTPAEVPPDGAVDVSAAAVAAVDAVDAVDADGAIMLDFPLGLAAQSTASRVDTVMSSWLGVRVGYVNNRGGGMFVGGDGALVVGAEGGGTAQVSVARTPVAVEGRGIVGARFAGGLFGVGGYGYGGVLVGGGAVVTTAFEQEKTRGFMTTAARVGGGMDLSFSAIALRIELGAGLRDLRPELHSQVALGARF
jgi:hypothetical protein